MTRFVIFFLFVPAVIGAGIIFTGFSLYSPIESDQSAQMWSHHIPHKNGGTIPDIIDLSITKTSLSDPAFLNTPLTYTLVITNDSALVAIDVVVTDSLPINADFKTAVLAQGFCNGNRIITCELGNLTGGQSVTATILITPTGGLSLTNVAQVSSFYVTDFNLANNIATETVQLIPGPGPAPPDTIRLFLPLVIKEAMGP